MKQKYLDFRDKCLQCGNSLQWTAPIPEGEDEVKVTCAKCKAKLILWPEYKREKEG